MGDGVTGCARTSHERSDSDSESAANPAAGTGQVNTNKVCTLKSTVSCPRTPHPLWTFSRRRISLCMQLFDSPPELKTFLHNLFAKLSQHSNILPGKSNNAGNVKVGTITAGFANVIEFLRGVCS
jgi:hypothetical protein